jgi:sialate O-acetylesterase
MLKPLTPYRLAGVIWYQGEANASEAHRYRRLFPTLIRTWRRDFENPQLPFLFVQLANFKPRQPQPSESNWAELREAQAMTLTLPRTAMAVAIDVGEADDIHPRDKQTVAHRLARAALATVYGRPSEYRGPTFRAVEPLEDGRLRVVFDHTGGKLTTPDNQPPRGFAIAEVDGSFVWAQASIRGDSVVLEVSSMKQPVAVRYAWADNPDATLYDAAGLPAVPFRTDTRPGLTTPE